MHNHYDESEHHHNDHSLAVMEEPLDPGSQSLADALRASFRVLTGVMALVALLYVFSGVFIVDQNQVAVVTCFGKQQGAPREPGFHITWPYPIGTVEKVQTSSRSLAIKTFWLNLSESEQTKELSDLSSRSGGLNPAIDGALLTGDRAIMHLLMTVQYSVTGPGEFIRNVRDEQALLRSILQNAAVAEAARTTADVIWKDARSVGEKIQQRAQARLNELETGIIIDTLSTDKSHYPLQVKEEFLEVQQAENMMRQLLQGANKEWEEKLKGAAGEAWEEAANEIKRLDQVTDEKVRLEIVDRIQTLLAEKATGEAGRRIKLAEGNRDRIVDYAHAEANRFTTMLEAYRENPELVRQRLRQYAIAQIFEPKGLSRWMLPRGDKFIVLNKNPEEVREAERERIRLEAEAKRK